MKEQKLIELQPDVERRLRLNDEERKWEQNNRRQFTIKKIG